MKVNPMRLILSNNSLRKPAPLTPEAIFESKYDWLLRWAMHFTQNDREAAEDLVQDAFVRLVTSWPRIKENVEQVEPVLYSYLKYCYLTEIRRGQRFNLQELVLIEFDDLRLSLQEEKTADPIEVQDDLRRIIAYLCWRKQTAKSASVLLLRFFHAYFPDEIAQIALMKRGSIDELLRIAREEVKGYLADPSSVEIMHHGKPPELMPRQVAVPPEQFSEELRNTIAQARTIPCVDKQQLLKLYQAETPKPISCRLLSHIVSCERCLDVVNSNNDLGSPLQRSQEGAFGVARRSKRTSGRESDLGSPASREEIRRSIRGGMERFRKLYEHRPRGLMIVVNGDVLAMRDVNSATSELKVQTGPERPLSLVEVLSEQRMPLLTLYVPSMPPEAPPELRHEIELSANRKLELLLRFTGDGAVIELRYNDPLFLAAANEKSQVDAELEEGSEESFLEIPTTEAAPVAAQTPHRSWWRRFLDWMPPIAMPEMSPMLATAMICAVASFIFLFFSFRASSVMKPEDLLKRAAVAETSRAQSEASGVIVQSVRIRTPQRKVERTLYRDVQGKRSLREQPTSREDAGLRTHLAALGIHWNDPLSADSFRAWHDHAAIRQDVVKRSETGLLTLTTTVSGGDVASESLTVRESDFRPVVRTVELRDAGTIEVAELNYSVLPWSSVNPDMFEPVSSSMGLGGNTHPSLSLHLPALLTPEEIDSAELGARLVLNRLQLDSSGRIELGRAADGIHVQGVVESDAEKRQLQSQLRMVPHVQVSVLTVREMEAKPNAGSEITSIRQSSVVEESPSSLEKYFTERGQDRAAVGAAAQEFVDSSFAVKHESEEISGLLQRFSSSTSLSGEARIALSELLTQHKAGLLAALGREERELLTLQLLSHPASPAEAANVDAEALRVAADHNFALSVELISSTDASSRPAQTIAPQLANSIAKLRAVALHISATAQLYPPSSGNSATANKNR
jgi:RNA polymerase sigma factor (sigma-70 family)